MGELAKKAMGKTPSPPKGQRNDDGPKQDSSQKNALKKLQREAKAQGCLLTSGGKGGLDSGLVRHVFLRDANKEGNFVCKLCGEPGTEENGGLGVHHKFQHIQAPKERAKGIRENKDGTRNTPEALCVICANCHDAVHNRDRAANPGEPDADKAMKGE